jgi:MFS family permease
MAGSLVQMGASQQVSVSAPRPNILAMTARAVPVAAGVIVAAAIPLLLLAHSWTMLHVFALLFGIGLGGDYMIIPLMAADLFGVQRLGRVMGFVLTADGLAEALSPMFVAGLRDRMGTYRPGFLLLMTLFLPGGAPAGSRMAGRRRTSLRWAADCTAGVLSEFGSGLEGKSRGIGRLDREGRGDCGLINGEGGSAA